MKACENCGSLNRELNYYFDRATPFPVSCTRCALVGKDTTKGMRRIVAHYFGSPHPDGWSHLHALLSCGHVRKFGYARGPNERTDQDFRGQLELCLQCERGERPAP